MGHRLRVGVASGLLALAAPAHAGGPDAVDDAYVETPRSCHVENWLIVPRAGNALSHVGVGCTPRHAPLLELDVAVERQGGPWSIQPGVKYTLLTLPGAFALGISGTAIVDGHGGYDGFALDVPMSIVGGKYTIISLDIGALISRDRHAPTLRQATWGAQVTQAVAPHFSLVGEVFGVDTHTPGEQAGLRWSPGPERVDIELRASHGGISAGSAVTLGLTVRV